jgi:hypothetical protein
MTRLHFTLPRPRIFWSGLGAAVAVAGIGASAMMPAPQALAAVVIPDVPLLAARSATPRDRSCASCGFMQTIRRTDPTTGLPVYEFSVRMRDGSSRESTGATVGRWVEGDRVMLIGGAAARALEEKKHAAL